MKRVFKILMYFLLTILFLIIILTVIAKLKENEITDMALRKVSETIDAPMEIDEASFTLIRRFPLATIEFRGMKLGLPFDSVGLDSTKSFTDTIAAIDHFYVSVKTKPLFKKEFEIVKIEIDGASINYAVDGKGKSNLDFLMSSDTVQTEEPDTSATALNIILNELLLKDINCNYSDSTFMTKANVRIPRVKITGRILDNYYTGTVKGDLTLTDCSFEETNLYLMKQTDLSFNLGYVDDSVEIEKLEINTDGALVDVNGNAILGEDLFADIKISGSEINLAELIKYAPKQVLKDAGVKKVAGMVDFSATVKGIISDSVLPSVTANVKMKNGSAVTYDYPAIKNISFNADLTNGFLSNNQTTNVDVKAFHFETSDSWAELDFKIENLDHPKYFVKSYMEVDLGEFKKYIPDTLVKDVRGKIIANIKTQGQLPDSISGDFADDVLESTKAEVYLYNLNIQVDSALSAESFYGKIVTDPNHFAVNNLRGSIPFYKLKLKDFSFDTRYKGKLADYKNLALYISSYNVETDSCSINGSATVKGLETCKFKLNTGIQLNLDELKTMLPDTIEVNRLSGNIFANVSTSGTINLDSITDQINDIVFERSTFDIDFANVSVEMPDPIMCVENFNGEVGIDKGSILINDMSGKYSSVEFKVDSTKIENMYNTIIQNKAERLYVQGVFNLSDIDYTVFTPFLADKATQSTTTDTELVSIYQPDGEYQDPKVNEEDPEENTDTIPQNWDYEIKGKLSISSFNYDTLFVKNLCEYLELSDSTELTMRAYLKDKILFDDISALFNIKDSLYIIDQFKFKAFEGSIKNSISYQIKPEEESVIWIKNEIDRMDIDSLLIGFNDFDQKELTHENVNGLISTTLDGKFVLGKDGMYMDSTIFKGTMTLENGALYNYEPLSALTVLPGLDDLDTLLFKTLNSRIFIFKNAIYVPQTDIKSNAMDITAYGMQTFGEDYEYHLRIYLGEILLGKTKRIRKKQDQLGEMDDYSETGLKSLFLVSYSLGRKSKSGLDNKNMQKKMKTKIKLQNRMLDVIFNPLQIRFDTEISADKKNSK